MAASTFRRFAIVGAASATLLAACTGNDPPPEAARLCQLKDAAYGDLVIGSYVPSTGTTTISPTTPAEPPAQPVNVGVDVTVRGASVNLRFSGDGPVSWSARPVAIAFDPTTGGVLAVSGTCLVQLDLWGVTSSYLDGSERTLGSPADQVAEVVRLPRKGGLTQVFIGLRSADAIEVVTGESRTPSLTVTSSD
ncbi:MAG: hypothetical protein LLG14_04680 [Nocardiaceae bacterium]|nr:hypothetical protein [Nocardiaceae bacterium]